MHEATISRPFASHRYFKKSDLVFSFVFLGLMVLSSNSFIYLPFTPVPMTTQTFTVLLSSVLLGSRLAFITQLEFIALGMVGLPVFAGGKSGLAALSGPTGGYIIGFLAASYLTGIIIERYGYGHNRTDYKKDLLIFISCSLGLLTIYILGTAHLFTYFFAAGNTLDPLKSFLNAFDLGVRPFIIIDIIKIFLLVGILKKLEKMENEG